MNIQEFVPGQMTGRLVPVARRQPDVQMAFVPDPLPPQWSWPSSLWPRLLEAHKALSKLDGTGKHLPNPEILVHPLHHREAQLSSKLEGTITDPQQQVLFELEPRYPTSASDPVNAYREVFNYRRALRLGEESHPRLPLSLRLIRNLHGVLMEGVRGSDQTPGEFRTIQNKIGQPARYVPPPPELLNETLFAFESYLHRDDAFDPLVRAFLAHYQFEAIHPFRDGNGRVGRLLLSCSIAEWCGLSGQWLYMSAFFEKRKQEYMDLLLGVSMRGDWESWIGFCLEGVAVQAIDAAKRCDELVALQREFHKRTTGGSVRLARAIDGLFRSPVVTVTQYSKEFDISYATARADLRKLEQAGIVQTLDQAQVKTYYCGPIYRITFEEVKGG